MAPYDTMLVLFISYLKIALNAILTFLENVSEEQFWNNLLGNRAFNLLQKYFGNEVILISAVFYAIASFRSDGYRVFQKVINVILNRRYVAIEVKESESIYPAVDEFVLKKTECLATLMTASAAYEPSNYGTVGLYPLINTTHKIEYRGHTLYVTRLEQERNGPPDSEESKSAPPEYIKISMRGKSLAQLKEFVQEWCDDFNKPNEDDLDLYVYRRSRWRHLRSLNKRSFESVTLQEGVKEGVVTDMQLFLKCKEWYLSRGIPYRRGYLLYGPPGTGKTTLIQALACKVNMNVAIVSLLEVKSDSEFTSMLCELPFNVILVIEDIDHYLSSSFGSKKQGGVTMSGMLNALDGIQAQEGSMIFMTGNNIEKLDPALLRPGRMDIKILLGYADRKQMKEMFWRFFGTDFDTMKPISDERKATLEGYCSKFIASIPEGQITTAEIQNYFITLLMGAGLSNPTNETFDNLISGVPEFLVKVQLDREQARKHKEKKWKEKVSSSEDDKSDGSDNSDSSDEVEV
ncbi:mitochondrial chaperone [Apophysomyces ossiformis]|uniref:Mitochondrial chaperone n=1 Tax=Apophysomyces ossiformis TaxID=679940 RepID=A0A8H7EL22_9FUNG|nr:mitochondrial chaperone [Apophysomyces ossiformis]